MMKNFCLLIFFLVLVNIYSVDTKVDIPKSEIKNKPTSLVSVDTSLGTLVGYKKTVNYDEIVNKAINVFYGIPFAEPLIYGQRFKKAKLIEKFSGHYYQATELKPHCWVTEKHFYSPNDTYSEDCLYANIWTPNLELIKQNGICSRKLPVAFYIIGGGNSNFRMYPFANPDGHYDLIYTGDYLSALHDIIFVTINYRQRMFASLYVEDEYPANLAMSDQELALRFVNKYIQDICGDKNQVTVLTNSVGGSYFSFLLRNKEATQLFNRAIMMSPPLLFSPIAPLSKNEQMLNSFSIINNVGCLNLSTKNLTSQDMRSLDKKIRLKYFGKYNGVFRLKEKLFLSELDKNVLNQLRSTGRMKKEIMYLDLDDYLDIELVKLVKFLSKYVVNLKCLQDADPKAFNVDNIYTNKRHEMFYDNVLIDEEAYSDYRLYNKLDIDPKISLMLGVSEDEMLKNVFQIKNRFYHDKYTAPVISKEEAKELVKQANGLKVDGEEGESFASLTADYYTDENKWKLSRGYYDSYINIINDQQIFCGSYFFSYYAAMEVNVTNYQMTYKPTKHFSNNIIDYDRKDATYVKSTHADELQYLFALPFRFSNHFNDLDRIYSLQLMKIWASYIMNGQLPALTNGEAWPIVNKHNPKPRFVEINNNYIRERKLEFEERCEKFYRPLLPFYKR